MVGIGTFDIFIFQFTDKTRIDTRHQHIIQIDEIEIIPPFIICPPPKVTELSTSYTAFVKLCIFLTELLHPLIGRDVLRAFSSLSPDTPYAVFDCPLLLENKTWRGFVSRVLVIDLAEEAAVERVVRRSGLAPETVRSILRSQLPRRARLDAADDVVYNGSTPEALADRIKLLHKIYGGK